ncbi:MAG: hypothetical protein EHM70_20880 [Chloroflexota bacterium]|nr:MAG: hypothetical protein EHM70_20880 [Chloroflexota bacterium]
MKEFLRALAYLAAMAVCGGLVYAACVIWPFHLGTNIGWAAGLLVALMIFIQYLAGLSKRISGPSEVEE